MKPLVQCIALAAAFAALPWTLPAQHANDPEGSDNSDVSPPPEPSHHHRRLHSHSSPSPANGATPDSSEPSPSPTHHHHRYGYKSSPSPSATPGSEDETPSPAATPAKKKRHHHATDPASASDAAPPETPASTPADSSETETPTPRPRPSVAPNATLHPEDLREYSDMPARIQSLIRSSLGLTRQNLTYTYSSDDPANGGMDCSGFIYYVLTRAGLKDVPRDASEQYAWVRQAGNFRAVISRNLDGFEMNELKPGDLLFWSGTYKTDRDPPVTHTMIYLGREKSTGNRVMVGSSDGRSYHGQQRWGVSVFDLKAVSTGTQTPGRTAPQFIGYGAIPGY